MDNSIRPNEKCIIGQPSCGYVFCATRECFIAYPFEESGVHVALLKKLLEERSIQPVEAGALVSSGQAAFCAKICSKIITAKFCIVMLDSRIVSNVEVPNANVSMEYGLMLGFNKYVIPFQSEDYSLPFNVSGLDTRKYNKKNFEMIAKSAIDEAIRATSTKQMVQSVQSEHIINFMISKGFILSSTASEGDRQLIDLGRPVGFSLFCDFSGLQLVYFGEFTAIRVETAFWRIKYLDKILHGRFSTIQQRFVLGKITPEAAEFLYQCAKKTKIIVLVTSAEDKNRLNSAIASLRTAHEVTVYSLKDVEESLADFQY